MPANFGDKLVIAISSRVLFDLSESDRIFREQGLEAYSRHQIDHEAEILEPGDAFPLVEKLLRINEKLGGDPRVEVILLSRNSADTGLRVFNSIEHYGLNISRAAFCSGASPYRYQYLLSARGARGCRYIFHLLGLADLRNVGGRALRPPAARAERRESRASHALSLRTAAEQRTPRRPPSRRAADRLERETRT